MKKDVRKTTCENVYARKTRGFRSSRASSANDARPQRSLHVRPPQASADTLRESRRRSGEGGWGVWSACQQGREAAAARLPGSCVYRRLTFCRPTDEHPRGAPKKTSMSAPRRDQLSTKKSPRPATPSPAQPPSRCMFFYKLISSFHATARSAIRSHTNVTSPRTKLEKGPRKE